MLTMLGYLGYHWAILYHTTATACSFTFISIDHQTSIFTRSSESGQGAPEDMKGVMFSRKISN